MINSVLCIIYLLSYLIISKQHHFKCNHLGLITNEINSYLSDVKENLYEDKCDYVLLEIHYKA